MNFPTPLLKSLKHLLHQRGESVCVAESCTGGLVSYWLSHLPGSSAYFKGSVVTYAESLKQDILGLAPEFIKTKGVVNEEAARAMAQGVRGLLKTDWSLSVTGIAGPACGHLGETVGQVAFSVSSRFATRSLMKDWKLKNREEIRHQSAFFALDFLLSEVKYQNKE